MSRSSTGAGRLLSMVAVVGAAIVPSAPAATAAPAGDVLIASSEGARLPAGARQVARFGGLRFSTVPVPVPLTADRYAALLEGRAGVAGAQPNAPIRRASIAGTCVDTPASPLLETSVTTNARSRPLPTGTRPVAVLDTGVDPAVPELAGRVLAASEAITSAAPALPDDDGHGTQIAAAAAAAPGLVAGISPTSPIMPIRISTASVLATPATIVKGLSIAVARKARVAVLPSSQLESGTSASTIASVGLAVNAAFSEGVITVAPSGNEGLNEPVFPGRLPHLLTVGSAGASAVRDSFSNSGPWLDLVAPGADLVLPAPPSICISGYARASGTSFSAAEVAGAVALIAAARPSLTTASLYDVVRRSATSDAGPSGFDVDTGFGLLNVGAGLGAPARDDPREVNDNVHWFKRRPSAFPTYLRRLRRATTRGSVSPGKDPQDAFKVYLRRGELLNVRVSNGDDKAVLAATVWSPRTGAFSMELPSSSNELRDSSGFTQNPAVGYRASRTGTYYVAIFAPDWTRPGEQGKVGQDLAPPSPTHTTYRVTMTRR